MGDSHHLRGMADPDRVVLTKGAFGVARCKGAPKRMGQRKERLFQGEGAHAGVRDFGPDHRPVQEEWRNKKTCCQGGGV